MPAGRSLLLPTGARAILPTGATAVQGEEGCEWCGCKAGKQPCWIRNGAGLIVGIKPSCCCIPIGELGSCAASSLTCGCDCGDTGPLFSCCSNPGAEVYLGCTRARATFSGAISYSLRTFHACNCSFDVTQEGGGGGAAAYEWNVTPCNTQGSLVSAVTPNAGTDTTWALTQCTGPTSPNPGTVIITGSKSGGFLPEGAAVSLRRGSSTYAGCSGVIAGTAQTTINTTPLASGSAAFLTANNYLGSPVILAGSWGASGNTPITHPCGATSSHVVSGSGSIELGPYCFCGAPMTDEEAVEWVESRTGLGAEDSAFATSSRRRSAVVQGLRDVTVEQAASVLARRDECKGCPGGLDLDSILRGL